MGLLAMGLTPLVWPVPAAVADEAQPKAIGAIGHIVPGSGVIAIVGTPGARVTKVPVRAGQNVKVNSRPSPG